MKKVVIVLVVLTTTIFARGTSGGIGTFGPALGMIDFSPVNRHLQANGFEQLSSTHWMFGGGGYAIANRTIIGGAGWGGSQTVASESVFCEVSYGGGEFRAGYLIIDLKNLLIAPMIGIGGGGYTIHLEPYQHKPFSFDELLQNPGRTSTISYSGFCLNPQIGITIPVSFIGIDIRGGYNLGPFTSRWRFSDNTPLTQTPEMKKGTPWVSLNIMLGGLSREKVQTRTKIEGEGGTEAPGEEPPPEKE